MEDDRIEASYLWTVEEFVKLNEAHRKHSTSPIVRFVGAFIIVVLVVVGVVLIITNPAPGLNGIGAVLCAYALFLIYLIIWGQPRGWRRVFEKAGASAQPGEKLTILADAGQLRMTTGKADGWVAWELVTKVVESREGFLIYRNTQFHWLPHHAFRDEEDRERFARLAEARAAKFVPLARG